MHSLDESICKINLKKKVNVKPDLIYSFSPSQEYQGGVVGSDFVLGEPQLDVQTHTGALSVIDSPKALELLS